MGGGAYGPGILSSSRSRSDIFGKALTRARSNTCARSAGDWHMEICRAGGASCCFFGFLGCQASGTASGEWVRMGTGIAPRLSSPCVLGRASPRACVSSLRRGCLASLLAVVLRQIDVIMCGGERLVHSHSNSNTSSSSRGSPRTGLGRSEVSSATKDASRTRPSSRSSPPGMVATE